MHLDHKRISIFFSLKCNFLVRFLSYFSCTIFSEKNHLKYQTGRKNSVFSYNSLVFLSISIVFLSIDINILNVFGFYKFKETESNSSLNSFKC